MSNGSWGPMLAEAEHWDLVGGPLEGVSVLREGPEHEPKL